MSDAAQSHTATPYAAQAHARAQAGTRVESMPTEIGRAHV